MFEGAHEGGARLEDPIPTVGCCCCPKVEYVNRDRDSLHKAEDDGTALCNEMATPGGRTTNYPGYVPPDGMVRTRHPLDVFLDTKTAPSRHFCLMNILPDVPRPAESTGTDTSCAETTDKFMKPDRATALDEVTHLTDVHWVEHAKMPDVTWDNTKFTEDKKTHSLCSYPYHCMLSNEIHHEDPPSRCGPITTHFEMSLTEE